MDKKDVLVVVDMQNDFVRSDGALYVKDSEVIVHNIIELIKKARKSSARIIFTQDWHKENDKEFEIFPKHCVKDTPGAEIIKELEQYVECSIKKSELSAWSNPDLEEIIKEDTLHDGAMYICGVATDFCVKALANGASDRFIPNIVVTDAVCGVGNISKILEVGFELGEQGSMSLTTEDIVIYNK